MRAGSLAAAALALLTPVLAAGQSFYDAFAYPDGLVTDEHAFFAPASADAKRAANWEVTSGALLALGGRGWTGPAPGGAVFRMKTARRDFGDAAVTFRVLNDGLGETPGTPARDWDGLQVWLRYQSEQSLYYFAVQRRDGTCVIKKKSPGGPSNGGSYFDLSPRASCPVPYGRWQTVRAEARNEADGSVSLRLYSGGTLVLEARDDGSTGGPPITAPGSVGLRGDNADLKFDDLAIAPLRAANTAQAR